MSDNPARVVSLQTGEPIDEETFDQGDRLQREAQEVVASMQQIGPISGVMVVAVFANGEFMPAHLYGDFPLPFTTALGALELAKLFFRELLEPPSTPQGGEPPKAA